jgi:putative ABC transport system substrate-binding protein
VIRFSIASFGFWFSRNRSEKVICFSLAALLFAFGFPAEAQRSGRIPVIGYFAGGGSRPSAAFMQGLLDLGYVEANNISLVFRTTEGKNDRYSDLAAELVHLKVDIIVVGGNTGSRAAKEATSTIPIVMASVGDPVSLGIVANLARPGGNITGLTQMAPDLTGKRLELLHEVLPKMKRMSFMWNPDNPGMKLRYREAQVAARALGLTLQALEIRNPTELGGSRRCDEGTYGGSHCPRADAPIPKADRRVFRKESFAMDLRHNGLCRARRLYYGVWAELSRLT